MTDQCDFYSEKKKKKKKGKIIFYQKIFILQINIFFLSQINVFFIENKYIPITNKYLFCKQIYFISQINIFFWEWIYFIARKKLA